MIQLIVIKLIFSLQKEVNEHKERVMEIKAYLEKKSRQIEKMKMEKQIKRKQFSELFQKRQVR